MAGRVRNNTRKAMLLLGIAILLPICMFLSPYWHASPDVLRKADIVVVFPVPELDPVIKEAEQLVGEGFADYLCIPTSMSLYRAGQNRDNLTALRLRNIPPGNAAVNRPGTELSMKYFDAVRGAGKFPRYYENTHVEMLMAKGMMDEQGFTKAILVSSPNHMNRIRVMAGRVFGPEYRITLMPSRFMKAGIGPLPSLKDIRNMFQEVSKTVWFALYELVPAAMGGRA